MKELLVISGKGGTGKTSIVGALAVLADNKVLADCDVDAADLHLLLDPTIREAHEFWAGKQAVLDPARCRGCGVCAEVCRFGAVFASSESGDMSVCCAGPGSGLAGGAGLRRIDPVSCEGCGVCARACPSGAISMEDVMSGHWFVSDTAYGPMVHARLAAAQENSGKLVTEVRREAQSIAERQGADYIITDGPPGIGCPVISSMSGADLALIVCEPTVSGVHDMKRVVELARHFGVKAAVCINKYDLDPDSVDQIEKYCQREGAEVAGKIPFDEEVVGALVRGVPVVAHDGRAEGQAARAMRQLWAYVADCLED